MKIPMIAVRSITASQSPTGKAIKRGTSYALASETTASSHIRAGLGRRDTAKSDPAKSAADKPAAADK